jgi:histidinol dehydrogenase
MMIKIISAQNDELTEFLGKKQGDYQNYFSTVEQVLQEVKNRGNQALIDFTARFDGAQLDHESLRVTETEINNAYNLVEENYLESLRIAIENIRRFHQKQLEKSWMEPDEYGSILGQLYRPLERVGVYVPGGTASYPSSVLMNVIPAAVAGVPEIVMVTPPGKDGRVNPYTLAAAAEAGAGEIYKVGGVQAVAALTYGTESIKKVDKITGPGNIYVTLAKKMVYGDVDIDMLAGPSEILVIADSQANPVFLAADLLSQAEHDVLASAVLVTPDRDLAVKVQAELERQLQELPRNEIAGRSIEDFGAIIVTEDMEEAISIANVFAPEHLELMVQNPFEMLGKIKNAGAVFLGAHTPEPVGDYWAGPNHILPTGGTARFYSPVTVDTFVKKTSVIYFSPRRLQEEGHHIVRLAEKEGLEGHANAVRVRINRN